VSRASSPEQLTLPRARSVERGAGTGAKPASVGLGDDDGDDGRLEERAHVRRNKEGNAGNEVPYGVELPAIHACFPAFSSEFSAVGTLFQMSSPFVNQSIFVCTKKAPICGRCLLVCRTKIIPEMPDRAANLRKKRPSQCSRLNADRPELPEGTARLHTRSGRAGVAEKGWKFAKGSAAPLVKIQPTRLEPPITNGVQSISEACRHFSYSPRCAPPRGRRDNARRGSGY